jgi:hypothetical protein
MVLALKGVHDLSPQRLADKTRLGHGVLAWPGGAALRFIGDHLLELCLFLVFDDVERHENNPVGPDKRDQGTDGAGAHLSGVVLVEFLLTCGSGHPRMSLEGSSSPSESEGNSIKNSDADLLSWLFLFRSR